MPALLKTRLLPEPIFLKQCRGSYRFRSTDGITVNGCTARTAPGVGECITELFSGAAVTWKRPGVFRISVGFSAASAPDVADIVPEAYAIVVGKQGMSITSGDAAGLYYGLQTLRQSRNTDGTFPCMTVNDAPRLPFRGVMFDLGRQTERFSYLKQLVRELSRYKINTVNLYVEAKLKYDKHPDIAYPQSYSPAQIKELVRWGKKYYVDIFPAVASLGHAENYLRHQKYRKLAEDGSIYQLNSEHPGTRKLLKDMYEQWFGICDSDYFNICCDESPHLGDDERNRALVEKIGRDGIFARHVDFLSRMVRKRNKKVLMWGDMLLHYPRLVGRIPRDTVILDWCYDDMRISERRSTEEFKKHGYPVVTVPAAYRSGELCVPAHFQYQHNVAAFIKQKYPLGLAGALTCMWEMFTTFIETARPGLLAAAEYSWSIDKVALTAFRRKAGTELFGPAGAAMMMDVFKILDGNRFHDRKKTEPGYHEGVEFIPSNPFAFVTGREHAWIRDLEKRAGTALAMLDGAEHKITRGRTVFDYLELAARQWRLLAWKRLVPNRVAVLLRKKDVKSAVTLLQEFKNENRAVRRKTVRLWSKLRYRDDANLRTYFTDFMDCLDESLAHKIKQLKRIGENDDARRLVAALPVIRFHTTNHSDRHVNILEEVIETSDDNRHWRFITDRGQLLWAKRDYNIMYMPPTETPPRFIRVRIGRTHVNWDFRKYPDDLTVTVPATCPGRGSQKEIVFESMDYRLKADSRWSYRVGSRKKLELLLERQSD